MKALKFVGAACTVGLIAGLAFVAVSPYETTPARATALPPPGTPVPNLVGEPLDAAELELGRLEVRYDVVGDDEGLYELLFDAGWTVCDMNPYGPTTVPHGRPVTLYVDHSCG